MVTLIYLRDGGIVHEQDTQRLTELIADSSRTFWLDLEAPSAQEFSLLTDVFHFHPLAVEDASRPNQRPKLDEYGDQVFLTADEVTLDPDVYSQPKRGGDDEAVRSRQVSAFLGSHYLVTVHVEPVEAVRGLRDRCDHNRHVLERGADFVLYSLLDVLVDNYFPLLDTIDERIDDLEDRIVETPQRSTLDIIFTMKRDLTRLRKYAGPLREVLQTLTARDLAGVNPKTLPYFRDVADHLFRVYESLDGYRELMSDMLGAYLSQVSNQMNLVMQRLSAVATVFLPITFITGVFGMNFEKQPWIKTDFWFWMLVMTVIAAGTYWWLRRTRMV